MVFLSSLHAMSKLSSRGGTGKPFPRMVKIPRNKHYILWKSNCTYISRLSFVLNYVVQLSSIRMDNGAWTIFGKICDLGAGQALARLWSRKNYIFNILDLSFEHLPYLATQSSFSPSDLSFRSSLSNDIPQSRSFLSDPGLSALM